MDKRTIFAFVLIGLVLIFYDDYIRWLYPIPPEQVVDTLKTEPIESGKAIPMRKTEGTIDADRSAIKNDTEISALDTKINAYADSNYIEKRVIVETESYHAEISTDGARLVSFVLNPNARYLKKNIELIHQDRLTGPSYRLWTMNGEVETTSLKYHYDSDETRNFIKIREGKEQTVEFHTTIDQNKEIIIRYKFSGDGYTFFYELDGDALQTVRVRDYIDVHWNGGLAQTDDDTQGGGFGAQSSESYAKSFLYYAGDVLEDLKQNTKKNEFIGPTSGQTRWGAVRNKYFVAALIPETEVATGGWMESRIDSLFYEKRKPNLLGVGLRLPATIDKEPTPVRVYIGPLDVSILKTVDPSLSETISWGWWLFEPFSKAILWSLKQLYAIMPNYGICIIIFSVLIKIILWPLTKKSTQSMAAMQQLQPKVQALREKYKNDAQRLQRETMALYKEEGVNPMGGCLPILLQMPLLIALFQVFSTTIEFRRASFVWWINDLSMPDVLFHFGFNIPLYGSHVALLPILMAISTYYQSKTTMTDPNQKMMLYIMPVFMLAIFNNFPSGLTMYYTLFNVWTLIQQKYTHPAKPKGTDKSNGKLPGK